MHSLGDVPKGPVLPKTPEVAEDGDNMSRWRLSRDSPYPDELSSDGPQLNLQPPTSASDSRSEGHPSPGLQVINDDYGQEGLKDSSLLLAGVGQGADPDEDDPLAALNGLTDMDHDVEARSQDIPQTLKNLLWNQRIEYPDGSNKYFVPNNILTEFIKPDLVAQEIAREHPNKPEVDVLKFAEATGKVAPKLLAILVWMKKSKDICNFLMKKYSDKDLPFRRTNFDNTQPFLLRSNQDNKEPHVSAMDLWDEQEISDFYTAQWTMLAPDFTQPDDGDVSHQVLHDNCILPFIEDNEKDNREIGGYSDVWGVRIHPAHQHIYTSTDPTVEAPKIALKRLRSHKREEFDLEVTMLKRFRSKGHKHLVKLLATFEFKGHYYLMFPYANKNLRSYWAFAKTPKIDATTVMWSLEQCHGVASGLDSIHNYQASLQKASNPDKSKLFVDQIGHGGLTGTKTFGRHGDIKPENILWSCELEETADQGILQICDFGMGRFNHDKTKSHVIPIPGSPSYEPPERRLGRLVSQRFDIWSLGCVYLEFIGWLLCGWDHLNKFSNLRVQEGPEGVKEDTFYTIICDENNQPIKASINPKVKDWIEELHKQPRCSRVLHDFLILVADEMLVIDDQSRIMTGPLTSRLHGMLKSVRGDEDYAIKHCQWEDLQEQPKAKIEAAKKALYNRPQSPNLSFEDGYPLPARVKRDSVTRESAITKSNSPALSRPQSQRHSSYEGNYSCSRGGAVATSIPSLVEPQDWPRSTRMNSNDGEPLWESVKTDIPKELDSTNESPTKMAARSKRRLSVSFASEENHLNHNGSMPRRGSSN